jgi:hypothetical protein
MKAVMLCVLMLSGCSASNDPGPSSRFEYELTWTCLPAADCERAEEVALIDHMTFVQRDFHFTSTTDDTFAADAMQIFSDSLPPQCSWLYYLTIFGHELERSRLCFVPGGIELELSIPNQDPTTFSMWLVEGRDVNVL